MAGGASLAIPVTVINGTEEGPCLWIDGVIHGDEPEGTLMCHLLRREVDPASLAGSLAPVMNTGAFEASLRGNPLDTFSYDRNRIYPGSPNGSSPSGSPTPTRNGWSRSRKWTSRSIPGASTPAFRR